MNMKWKITMMGKFTLRVRGKEINFGASMGKQIASIFAYLILHRDRAITKEQLIEVFWPDSRNPLNALKFAIFRLRKALEELPGGGGRDWIQTVRGGYRLNPSADFDLDIAHLDKIALRPDCGDAKTLTSLIQGEFLADLEDAWIVEEREKQWQKVLNITDKIAEDLEQNELVQQAQNLYKALLAVEPFNDQVNYLMLRVMIRQRQYNEAIHYYEQVAAAFRKEYGIEFQGKSQALIYFISVENGEAVTMEELVSSLNEDISEPLAFFCDRSVFQTLYQARVREIQRSRDSFYLMMMELRSIKGAQPENDQLEYLSRVLESELRSSDIFCRISRSQYAVMMNLRRQEDGEIAAQRICTRFHKRYPADQAKLQYYVCEIQPQTLPNAA